MGVTSFRDFMKNRTAGAASAPAISLSDAEDERRRREEEAAQRRAIDEAQQSQRAQNLYNSYMDEANGTQSNEPSFARFMLNKNGVNEASIRTEQAQRSAENNRRQAERQARYDYLEAHATGSATQDELTKAQDNIKALGLTKEQDAAIHEYIEGWGYDAHTGAGATEFLKRSGIDYDTFEKAIDNYKIAETGKVSSSSTLTPLETVEYAQANIDKLNKEEKAAVNQWIEGQKKYQDYWYVAGKKANPLYDVFYKGDKGYDDMDAAEQKLKDLGWDDEKIDKYLNDQGGYAKWVADYQNTEQFNKDFDIDPNASTGEKIGRSVLNSFVRLATPLKGFESMFDSFGDDPNGLGRTVYGVNSRDLNVSQHGEQQVTQNAIGDEHPVGQFAYSAGMSTAEAAEYAMLGGSFGAAGEAFTLGSYATQAYSTGYKEAKERGATNEQAHMYGAASGAAEAITEKLSLDHLWGMAKGGKVGKKLVVDWLMQAGIEGSEEMASDLLNRYSDYLILGADGKNAQTRAIEEYEKQGMSREEATKQAELDFWRQVMLDGAAGAISGGVLGGGGAVASNMNANANQAVISNYYNNLAKDITGDTEYDNAMRQQAQQYANNPIRLMADTIDDSTEVGRQQKAEVLGYAEKYAQNGKLSAQDNFALNRSMELAEEARTPQQQYEQYLNEVQSTPAEYRTAVTGITASEGRARMQEAIKNGDTGALAAAYNAMRSSTSSEARNDADEALNEFSAMARDNGITDRELEGIRTSAQDAYVKGLKGESRENMGALSEQAERAYNEGTKKRIESRAASVESAGSLKGSVETSKGAVTLSGTFDLDGKVETNRGAISVEDISDNPTVRKAYEGAAAQKTVAAKNAYIANIKDGNNLNQYHYAFNKFYNAGATGASYESTASNGMGAIVEAALGSETTKAIYEAGRSDYAVGVQKEATENMNVALGAKKAAGSFQDIRTGKKANIDTAVLDLMAKHFGFDIKLTDSSSKGVKGQFNTKTSTITISETDGSAIVHELLEGAEIYAGEDYNKLHDMVIGAAQSVLGSDGYQNAINAYLKTYEKVNADQTALESSKEFVNDMMVALMSTDKGQQAMADYLTEKYSAKEAQSLGGKIKDFFKKVVKSFKSLIDNSNLNSYQKQMAEVKLNEQEKIFEQFFKTLDSMKASYEAKEESEVDLPEKIEHSLEIDTNGKMYVDIQEDIISGITDPAQIKDYIREFMAEYYPTIDMMGFDLPVTAKSRKEFTNSEYTKRITRSLGSLFTDKMRMAANLDEIVNAADHYTYETPKHARKDDLVGFIRGNVQIRVGSNDYSADVVLADRKNAGIIFYDVVSLRPTTIKAAVGNTTSQNVRGRSTTAASINNNITPATQNGNKNNVKHSLTVDNEGRTLTQEQQDFFAESKVRDENGALKVMYHGTNSYGFDVFDIKKAKYSGLYGRGFYFADSKAQSGVYGKTYEVYLNLVNPLQTGTHDITEDQMRAFINEIANDEDYGIDNYGYEATPESVLESLEGKDDFSALQDLNASCIGDFTEALKIFNRVNGTSYDGIMAPSETIAFYPNQIKEVDNEAPTSADSIKYSLDLDEDRVFYVRNTEVVKNPTSKEYEQMREDIYNERPWLRGTGEPVLRHTWDEEGNEYYWDAMGGLHAQIEPAINERYGTRTSQQWQWWTREDKDDYPVDYSSRYSLAVDEDGFEAMEKASKKTKNVKFDKNLIAVHNMTADQLDADLNLNGFPSPSVAIIRAGMEHSKYGDVSVLFKRDTIDPKANKQNKVYGGDAWTPTFPSIEVKVNEGKAYELQDKFDKLVPQDVQSSLSRVALDVDNLSDYINRNSGDPVNAYKDKAALKYAFLKENGVDINVGLVDKPLAWQTNFKNDQIIPIANEVGEKVFDDFWEAGGQYLKDHPEFELQVRDILNRLYKEKYAKSANEHLRALANKDFYTDDNFGFAQLNQIAKGVRTYFKEGVTQMPDYASLNRAIDEAMEGREDAYTDWLDSFFDGIIEKRGLRNEKDLFTNSGNRRSWEALHDDVTLENIVRIMNSEDAKGADGFFAQSAIQAIATKDFKSIEDIHKNEGMLRMLTEEEHSALTDDHSRRFTEIIHEIEDKSEKNGFMAFDRAAEAIADAVREAKTVKGIDKVLREYTYLHIHEDTAQKIYDLMQDISNLPTGYFEAKPRRAVWLNEIAEVILPDNVSQDLLTKLEDLGVQYKTYQAGNEDQRTELLDKESAAIEDARFSLDIDDAWEEIFNETYADTASILEEGMEALKGQEVDSDKIRRIAIDLKKEYGSTINTKMFADMMEKAFAYMQTTDHVNYNDMMRVMQEIATPVIEEATSVEGSEAYNNFVNALKGYQIKLNDKQMQEVKNAYGSYVDFKRAAAPINFNKNGTYLDNLWEEIVASTDYLLDSDISDANEPLALLDVLESLRPAPTNNYKGNAEDVAKDLAMRIVEEYLGVEEAADIKEAVDKQKAKNEAYKQKVKDNRKAYRQQTRERYNEKQKANNAQVREKYRDKLEKARADMKAKRLEYQQSVRDRYNQRLAGEKAKLKEELDRGKLNNRLALLQERYNSLDKLAELKAKNKKHNQDLREARAAKEQREKISKRARQLSSWIMNPTEQHHLPSDMIEPVLEFLNALDFVEPEVKVNKKGMYYVKVFNHSVLDSTGKRQMIFDTIEGESRQDVLNRYYMALGAGIGSQGTRTWVDRMGALQDLFERAKAGAVFEHRDMDALMQTIDPTMADAIGDLIKRNRGLLAINNLSSTDLKTINNALRNIMHAINQGNKAFAQNAEIDDMGKNTLDLADEINRDKTHGRAYNKLMQTLRLDMATPETYFSLLGDGGKKVYRALRQGFNTKVRDIRKAQGFFEETMKGVKKKELAKWTGLKADLHTFNTTDGQISLTTAQIMSLYELNKRQQAVLHFKGGIEADTITKKIGLTNRVLNQNTAPVHLTDAELENIIDTLTPEQKALADKLQQYMAVECAKDGNETSMLMYGFEKFVDNNYFPISTDKSYISANNSNTSQDSLNGIERSGFTKQLVENAANPIIIKDIFDVFTNHVSDMATYHGFAPAMKDALRWFNFKTVDEIDENNGRWNSVQKAINKISGEGGTSYFTKLMKDLNGSEKSQYIGGVTDALISNYKAAAVGANIRVIIQQPTAYFRAMNAINPKYLMGAAVSPVQAHRIGNQMREESEIAWWKSQGYFETSIGQSMKEIITGQHSAAEELKNKSMALAGWADDVTWGVLYTAVTKEQQAIARKQGGVSKEELSQRIKDRFDEVVDQTQVVDSTLHRSQYMRSKDTLNKLQTAFMAEPTKSYNMLMKAIVEDTRSGKGFKKTAKAATVFAITNVITSAAAAVIDAFRKDTDDTDWWEVYLEALKDNVIDNVNPLNLIPVLKDVSNTLISTIKGDTNYNTSSNRMDMDAINSLVSSAQAIVKYAQGDSNKTPYGMYMTLARPISQMTGVPLYNFSRDLSALYNSFMPDLQKTIASNKYSSIYDAIKADKDVEEIQELVNKVMDEEGTIYSIKSGITSRYKSDYFDLYTAGLDGDEEAAEKAHELAEKATKGMLAIGMTEEEAEETILEWQDPTYGYSVLDKAIESGEGIEDAVKYLQEGKDNDKMIEHVVNHYGSTIRYNRDNGIESDIEDNVNKALDTIEKGTRYDAAYKALEEKAAEKAAKQQATAEKNEAKEATYKVLDSGSGDYKKAVDAWAVKIMGEDTSVENQKEAGSTIKSALTKDYTKPLVKAYKSGDYSAQQMLVRVAMIKAYIDEQTGTKIANKYGGDYYQYEIDQITKTMEEYDKSPW